jgi:DNA-binding SARP family transcriptional activator
MLYLSLFGHLSVARREGAGLSKGVAISGRPGSLFVYLALAKGRFFTRTELISTLWADQSDTARVGTFNTTLWRLRKALAMPPLAQGEIIVCDRHGAVGLGPDADLELDVNEFVRLVTPGLNKPMEQLDESDVSNLRRGVNLYRDDILGGFTDDWALREREMHRRLHLNALARLMQLCVLSLDHESAIRHAQSILDRDPLREDIHRELMRLFLVTGQRAVALRQFEVCRASLRKELAIQPMRETLALYQQIADSAIGRGSDTLDLASPRPPTRGVSLSAASEGSAYHDSAARRAARDLITNARHYLAEADAQLQQSLPLFGDSTPRLPS